MPLRVEPTSLQDVLLVQANLFADERGYFMEAWQHADLAGAGIHADFVQDNLSRSMPGVLRGLHYQLQRPQGKLVRVIRGRVLDVAVDLRRQSPTFGQHVAVELDDRRHQALWIPPGFAHGFYILGDEPADLFYKCTDYYSPEGERTLRWDDPALAIDWPLTGEAPLVSEKDSAGDAFTDAEVFENLL
jgi:dTDP-4-dehydrorhamnose 3,5-epimerase